MLVNNTTDKTAEIFSDLGAVVKVGPLDPFRFDAARNLALDMVPQNADLCVCSDLDDIWPAGWRNRLEQQWRGEDCLRYKLLTSNGEVWADKIHTRNDWYWEHPCHEILEWLRVDKPPKKDVTDIEVRHCPDQAKVRNYLPLLEMDAWTNPENARALHYLGREYMYQGRWNEALGFLQKSVKHETWLEQKGASYRFMSRCAYRTGNTAAAVSWLYQAIATYPGRESFVDMAWLCYQNQEWAGAVYFVDQALKITKPGSYPSEYAAWCDYPQKLREEALAKLREA